MDCDHKRHLTFPLRLPSSMRDAANVIAHQDGISLNHFISLAVAEKLSRLEQSALAERSPSAYSSKPTLLTRRSAL